MHLHTNIHVLANCPYLIGTVPILTQEKGREKSDFIICSYFCKNLPVVMYRKFRNVPILKDIPPICPYFLGFRVGKYMMYMYMQARRGAAGRGADFVLLVSSAVSHVHVTAPL